MGGRGSSSGIAKSGVARQYSNTLAKRDSLMNKKKLSNAELDELRIANNEVARLARRLK